MSAGGGGALTMFFRLQLRRGSTVELTRNRDLGRGFYNGALCKVRAVYSWGIELDMWHGGVDTLTRRYDYTNVDGIELPGLETQTSKCIESGHVLKLTLGTTL